MRKKGRHTRAFIFFLIIAGLCNLFTRTPSSLFNTIMFCTNFMIILGLILYWSQSVRARILPTKSRTYMVISAVFMIFYIFQRVFKYRIVVDKAIPNRYAAYAYFVPRIMIPTFLLIIALNLALGNKKLCRSIEIALLTFSGLLACLSLSNDLHHFIYRPAVDISEFNMTVNSYTWGPCFYLLYTWMIVSLLAGLVTLFIALGKRINKLVAFLLFSIIFWISFSLANRFIFDKLDIPKMYFGSEIDCFCMILIFECCIRSRLIPHNDNYEAFFAKMKLPIMITDSDLKPVYTSEMPITATTEELTRAKKDAFYPEVDTRLSSMKIRAGYAFWTENEKELHAQRRHLAEANELLSEENQLIEVENKLKEQKAHLDAQNKVYKRITTEINPKQRKIEALLNEVDPSSGSFAKALGHVCVLNAYSKRKTNLLLLSEETLPESNRELFLALAESCRFLKCCGIEAAAVGAEYSKLPLNVVNDLYDTFETVIETYLDSVSRMTVSILTDGIRIAMEAGKELALPDTVLPVSCKESDGILFFTILRKKEGDVA